MSKSFSPLRQWLLREGYFLRREDTSEATHLLLDGGRLNIPLSRSEEFLRLLARDLDNGWKHYIVENRTPVFKLICDVDMFYPEEIPARGDGLSIESLLKKIQEVIFYFYKKDNNVIVLTTESKRVLSVNSEEVWIKTGLHLIWPKINVDSSGAQEILRNITDTLERSYGSILKNSWEDAIDTSVVTKNGLRMALCGKMHYCKRCRKDPSSDCPDCKGSRRVDEGRIYLPSVVYDSQGAEREEYLRRILSNKYFLLKESSIRTDANAKIVEFENEPKPIKLKEKKANVYKLRKMPKGSVVENGNKIRIHVSPESREYGMILDFMKRKLPKVYKDQKIKGILSCCEGDYFIVKTVSQYCMNLGREHNSCGIYFLLNKKGLFQKCFCQCKTTEGRKSGLCCNYTSEGYELTEALKKRLFGDKKKESSVEFQLNTMDVIKENKELYIKNCENFLDHLEKALSR